VKSVLILETTDSETSPLAGDLRRIGVHVIGVVTCENLAQDAVLLAPDAVVAMDPQPSERLFAAVARLESARPVPVAVFTDDVRIELIERAFSSGIHAWVIRGYKPDRLRSVLQLAQVRFRRESEHRKCLAELTGRLEERKLVDRAKGLLMSHQGMDEEHAFRALRDAAMQGKQRLGQVAQRLIEAARCAEAVNRSGQLRMLSQRLVKLHALASMNTGSASAEALTRESMSRLERNLSVLSELVSMATFGEYLDAALEAWSGLKSFLRASPCGQAQNASMLQIDAAAERLLEAAERLTDALEAAGPMKNMQMVNLAGRQRMLAQRVAKMALLRQIAPQGVAADPAQMQATVDAFEQAMAALRRSPLTSADGRAMLRTAQDAWKNLLQSSQLAASPQGRLQIAQSSEALLEIFDSMTEGYEHNLKVLVG